MLLYLLVIVLCSLCVTWKLWFKKSYSEPPVLSGWLPIIGHAYRLMGNNEQFLTTVKNITDECTQKGGLVTFYLGLRRTYWVTDPDDSVNIMNACLKKPFIYDFFKPLLGDGLLTADVPTWKKNRKLLNPAFNQQVLEGFIEVFNNQAKKLVDQFTKEVGKPFDHELLLRLNNLETICSTSLGVYESDSEFSAIFAQYVPRLASLVQSASDRVKKIWLHSDFIYNKTTTRQIHFEKLQHVARLSKVILENKKIERKNREEKASSTKDKPEKFKPFIELILDLASETGCFTDEQLRAETETIIAAGHDTIATQLTFALAVLGSHKEVQEKAYQEIRNVFGDLDKTIDKEDLSKLEYIEAILKESLRLHAIVPVVLRHIDKDVKLKNYTVKANTDCFVSIHGVLRQNIWGPDTDQFRPERWSEKETLPDPKYFAAFGLGRRACIGKSYAMMAMKIFLISVIRKFHISSDINQMVCAMHLFLRPQSGHYITVTPRNK